MGAATSQVIKRALAKKIAKQTVKKAVKKTAKKKGLESVSLNYRNIVKDITLTGKQKKWSNKEIEQRIKEAWRKEAAKKLKVKNP